MQTTAAKHPIQRCMQQAINSKSQHYVSPLEYIARSFPNYAAEPLETILPYARPPWWAPNFTINVSGNKETAKLRHENTICNDNTLYVYTDGSGIDGQVEAAPYSPTTLTKQQCLGSENRHNIYSAELTAIEIAVNIAQTCQNNYKQCVIYVDSQAAVKAIVKPGRQSGQSILCSLLSSIDNLISSRGIDLHIEWIPGHRDIEGNEMADKAAKAARQGNVIFLGGLWDLCPGKPEPQDGPINPPFFQISQERPAPPSASQSPISNRQRWSNLVALNRSGGILPSNCH